MKHNDSERVIALAGVFQAAWLVHQVSEHGMLSDRDIQPTIHSLFVTDADNIIDIFTSLPDLKQGLQTLYSQLAGGDSEYRNPDITRYALTLIYLERKLAKQPQMLNQVSELIDVAITQVDYFGSETHENLVARLADIYQQTISTLRPRIMVKGDQATLGNPAVANLVRALLLAGIRAAIAWRQCGGSRWQFVFGRKKIIKLSSDMLSTLPDTDDSLH